MSGLGQTITVQQRHFEMKNFFKKKSREFFGKKILYNQYTGIVHNWKIMANYIFINNKYNVQIIKLTL